MAYQGGSESRTFSNCWNELGCWALSMVGEAVADGLLREAGGWTEGGLERCGGCRKDLGETRVETMSR